MSSFIPAHCHCAKYEANNSQFKRSESNFGLQWRSGKEHPKKTFQLHYNHCVKNVQKCEFCGLPVPKAEFADHLEQMKGTTELAKTAASEGDFERLYQM